MASLASEAGDFVHLANTPQTPPPREESRPKVWESKLLVQYVGLNVAEASPGQTLDGGIDGKTKLKMRLELRQKTNKDTGFWARGKAFDISPPCHLER
jgi:hypothetical protein